jgi:hypothetical protein
MLQRKHLRCGITPCDYCFWIKFTTCLKIDTTIPIGYHISQILLTTLTF